MEEVNKLFSFQKPWVAVAAILLLALPLIFFELNGWSFLDPDEGRYGTIPYQMIERADFITPKQNEVKFFDKPPLLYWGVAASYAVFGYEEWAARLVPALAALIGLLTVYGLGKRMFGERAGFIAAVILATSLMWPVMARIVVTDMLVSALIFVALSLWWLGHSETESRSRQSGYFVGFWISLALGALAKGPIVLVLTGGGLFLYSLLCRQWRAWSQMRWGIGIPLFFLIAAPWFFLVAQRNPEFNHFFWYDQHIGRFLGKTSGNDHIQGATYYLQFLPVILFPWSVFVPCAIIAGWRHLRSTASSERSEKQRAVIYLLCAVGFTLSFFSASKGKLLTYILPVVPPLALLLAAYFDRLLTSRTLWNRGLTWGTVVLTAILLAMGVAIGIFAPAKLRAVGVQESAALILALVFMAWAVFFALAAWRMGIKGVLAATAGGFTAVLVTILWVAGTIMPDFTTASLVKYIRPGLESHAKSEVLTLSYIGSVPFYTRRRVEILGIPDEMRFGVEQMPFDEKQLWVFEGEAKLRNLREEMTDPYPVYCFVRIPRRKRHQIADLLHKIGDGATPIAANERYLVFGNRAAIAATPPQANLRGDRISRLFRGDFSP